GVRVVWTFHHLLLDGWSSAAVVADVVAAYAAARGGEPARLPVRGAFRDHLAWLAGRDRAAGRAVWGGPRARGTAPPPTGPGAGRRLGRSGAQGRQPPLGGVEVSAAKSPVDRSSRSRPVAVP
ncbi:condensation domain-containing protein, partial [Streptomyces albidoflavus]